MMRLDERLWYVRLFFWGLSVYDEFMDGMQEDWVREHGTNLCHFLRTILIYTPAILLLHVVLYASAIAAITAIPIYLVGFGGYFFLLGGIVVVAAIVYGIKWYRQQFKTPSATVTAPTPMRQAQSASPPRGPSFWGLLWQWLVAQKQRFCPTITFEHTREQVS